MSAAVAEFRVIPKERRMEVRRDTPSEMTNVITITAAKLITLLVVLITAVVTVENYWFSNIVESKIERLGLVYAAKQEIIPRAEYEIRRAESQDDMKRANDRIRDLEQRLTDHLNRTDPSRSAAR